MFPKDARERRSTSRFDLSVRAAGAVLLACATLAIALLARLVCTRPHDATPFEMLLAAISFMSATTGAVGLTIGRGLFALVPLPPRWRSH